MYDNSKGFTGSLPVGQTLLPAAFTGTDTSVDFQDVTPFGGYPLAKSVLPWTRPTANALFLVANDASTMIYWTVINKQGQAYNSALVGKVEYFVRE